MEVRAVIHPISIEDIINKELSRILVEELEKLPIERGIILLLRFFEDLSFQDIAEVLNINPEKVVYLYKLGLNQVREQLKERYR